VEQLNIEGKRSGDGFVAHKATLVNALSRALADRITLVDLTIGRKGFLAYLKAIGGSNMVKIVPSNGSDSEAHTTDKRLKVVCGSNTSYIGEGDWIGEKTPYDFAEVRVSPNNIVKPNVGVMELVEALNKVLPFTANNDDRPVLKCVNFVAGDGKLTMVSADGFRLAVTSLDYDDGEGQALISRDELKGVATALRKAKRARLTFESGDVSKRASLIIDTELIRYRFASVEGQYPNWQNLIPTEFNAFASFDSIEAIKAANSLHALADSKDYAIDCTIGDGKVVMANPDDKGEAELPADTEGEAKIRIDGSYLLSVLKACGGMVDFSLTNGHSPMLFSHNGYRVVVMPMMTAEARESQKGDTEAQPTEGTEAQPTEGTEPQPTEGTEAQPTEGTEPQPTEGTEPQPVEEKPKRNRKAKELVAV
jgi:hypothetical protein